MHEHVQLSLSLRTSHPHSISVLDACPDEPLKLIASIEQTASPFPDRAVTILTKYSCLDTSPGDDAFQIEAMSSPRVTNPDAQCRTRWLPLRPVGVRVYRIRIPGGPDLLRRDPDDGFRFLTIPPVGNGHAEVVFELPPSRLVRRLGDQNESVQDKLMRFLRVGDTYSIKSNRHGIHWWAFGSLEDEKGLKGKKISRWTFPDDLSLTREPGEDETASIASSLRDLVDLHDVNRLSSRSAVEGEQKPDVRWMRSEGWVFGEPESRLVMTCAPGSEEAFFSVTA
ncbi:hypothetical protein GGR56DRAFT_659214 [Xylariaceae sp. FL0804]|nr:hypothetical protein GGR56DRAFT_659214 [Xylariaceae sp. FL0804]